MSAETTEILNRMEQKIMDVRGTKVKNIAIDDAQELFRLVIKLGFTVARDTSYPS